MSRFEGVADLAPQRIWEGVTARAVHGERLTLALIELDPDSLVPEHSHDNEQVGIMVEGSFVMRVGGETCELRRGDTWSIPPDSAQDRDPRSRESRSRERARALKRGRFAAAVAPIHQASS